MNILFVASDLGAVGGIQTYNKKFLAALLALGEKAAAVELKGLSVFKKALFAAEFFLKVFFVRPDVILCTNINFSPLALFAKKLFKIPYAVTIYGIEVAEIKNPTYLRALREATAIVKLFDQAERDVVRQVPEARGKILRVPNSVDGARFRKKEKSETLIGRYGLSGKKVVLTITRISKHDGENKGYERVIRALPSILGEVPSAHYLLAGSGDDVSRMKDVARKLGVESAVTFAGSVKEEEIVDHYNLADLVVLPSKNEGFPPIVFLESLSCGVPILGGGQPDAQVPLWREDLGLIVPPDDIGAIGEGITKILSGRAPTHLYNRDFLRKRVIEEYGLDRHRKYVEDFLKYIKEQTR